MCLVSSLATKSTPPIYFRKQNHWLQHNLLRFLGKGNWSPSKVRVFVLTVVHAKIVTIGNLLGACNVGPSLNQLLYLLGACNVFVWVTPRDHYLGAVLRNGSIDPNEDS